MNRLLFTLMLFCISGILSAQTFFSEDFESGIVPSGWTQTTLASDGGWIVGTDLSSSYWTIPPHTFYIATNDDNCNCNKIEDRLISPSIDLSAASGTVILEFEYSFDMITYGGGTEMLRILVSDAGGTPVEISPVTGTGTGDWNWKVAQIDLSAYVGSADIKIYWEYTDEFAWSYGAAIDDIKVFTPVPYDVAMTSIDLPSVLEEGMISISGSAISAGANTVNSVDLAYSIDGGTPVSTTVTGLSANIGESFTFTHDIPWNAVASPSPYTVELSITAVNGNPDANPADNSFTTSVSIVEEAAGKKVLAELFNSTNNPPASSTVPPFYDLTNINEENVELISYSLFFPAPTDPFYLFYPEQEDRFNYYGLSFVAAATIDGSEGVNSISITQADIDAALAVSAPLEVKTPQLSLSGSTLSVTVDAESVIDLTGENLTLHIALVEKQILGNPDPNPTLQTEFLNILRAMLPDPSGTSISLGAAGDIASVTETYALSPMFADLEDYRVIAFVQDESTKAVHNTSGIDVEDALGCATPTGLASLPITSIDAGIKWMDNPFADQYRVVIEELGVTSDAFLTPRNRKALSGLTPGATYEWAVQAFCSNGVKSSTSTIETFIMPLLSTGSLALETRGNIIRTFVPESNGTVEVYSADGRLVTSYQVSQGWNDHQLSESLAGVYIIRLTGDQQLISKRAAF